MTIFRTYLNKWFDMKKSPHCGDLLLQILGLKPKFQQSSAQTAGQSRPDRRDRRWPIDSSPARVCAFYPV
jgi:hypothetical protein